MKAACTCSLFFCADNSAILVSHKDKDRIQEILVDELCWIRSWLSDNRLLLHLGKTESVLFGSKARLSKDSELDIKLESIV